MDIVNRIKNGMKSGLLIPSQNTEYDFFRKRIIDNIICSSELYISSSPDINIPHDHGSRLPHHNLYLTFYHVLEASCLILQFSFAYLATGNDCYKDKAKEWINAVLKWDINDWSFYSSARMMISLACAEDWLNKAIDTDETRQIHKFLYNLCKKHESEIDTINKNLYSGCHPALYTSGFGIASILLENEYEEAKEWLQSCINIFTNAMLPKEISADGTYNGINWALAYSQISKLQFMDCLRNIKKIDLYRNHYNDITRCVPFLKQAYIGPDELIKNSYYAADTNMITGGSQLNGFSSLYLRLASLTNDPTLQWIALRDENAGEIERLFVKVKKGTEAILNYGPFTYLWYDPELKAIKNNFIDKEAFFEDGEIVISREDTKKDNYLFTIEGRSKFGITEQSMNINIYRNYMPVFQKVVTKESLPIQECNAPAVGGEYLRYGKIISRDVCDQYSRTLVDCVLATQEITCYKGNDFKVEISTMIKQIDVLRYSPLNNFDPDNGCLTIEFKISKPYTDITIPKIIFSTGLYHHGSYGSCINLGIFNGGVFGVSIKDTRGVPTYLYHPVNLNESWFDKWHEAKLIWKNFNSKDNSSELEIVLDGAKKSLLCPDGTFDFKLPNTPLWFGMSVQEADTFAGADFRKIEITDGKELLFRNTFKGTKDAEYARGDKREGLDNQIEYWLHPCEVIEMSKEKAIIGSGGENVILRPFKPGMIFESELLKPEQGGFAGEALEVLREQKASVRLKLKTIDNSNKLSFMIRGNQ